MESSENPPPVSSTFACPLCGESFRYALESPDPTASEFVECPHCKQESEIHASNSIEVRQAPEPPAIIPPPFSSPIWFGHEHSTINVLTSAGSQLEIKEVLLYDEQDLQAIASVKARATELFGGAQSQYGFIGDVGWVVGMATLQNFILQAATNKMAKEGLELLETIRSAEHQLRKSKNYFPVGLIENMEHPVPSLWRAEQPTPKRGFIHSGDDIVTIKDITEAAICVRWSAVVQYSYRSNQS